MSSQYDGCVDSYVRFSIDLLYSITVCAFVTLFKMSSITILREALLRLTTFTAYVIFVYITVIMSVHEYVSLCLASLCSNLHYNGSYIYICFLYVADMICERMEVNVTVIFCTVWLRFLITTE